MLLSIVLPDWVHAEDLTAAWQAALGHDQRLKATRSRVSAAAADLAVAESYRLPTVAASAGITRFDEAPEFDFLVGGVPTAVPMFDSESVGMADATLTYPVYTGGRVTHEIAAANAMLTAREFESAASAQDVKLSVARHYIGVLRARRAVEVADSNVTSLSAHLRDVENMFESGTVARNDYLAAAVSLADAEQHQLQADNRLDLARAAYNRALGRPLGAPVQLDENLPGIDAQLDMSSLEALTELALENRDELGSLDAAVSAYRSQAESARASTRPQLALTGGYMTMQNEFLNREEFWMVGVGVRWNLFDGGQAREKANSLSFRSTALAQQSSDLRSMIELEVRRSWLRLEETRKRRQLTERAVEQAVENLRVVRDRYRNGEGTNTEVLDAEMLRSTSRSNYDNADFDAKLALYELARGAGRL